MKAQTRPIQYLDFCKDIIKRKRKYPQVIIKKPSFLNQIYEQQKKSDPEVIQIEDTPQQNIKQAIDSLSQQLQNQNGITYIQQQPEVMQVEKSERQLLAFLEGSTSTQKTSEKSYFQQELEYLNNMNTAKSQKNLKKIKNQNNKPAKIYYEQVSAILHNCKISLSIKDIHEYSDADVLMIPFENNQFEIYPGCHLREKLASQCEKLSKAEIINGGIYLKRKNGIHNYQYMVFMKVKLEDFGQNLKIGLNLLLKKIKSDKKNIKSIVLCLQEGIEIDSIMDGITESTQLKNFPKLNIYLSCRDQNRFQENFRRFLKLTRTK